MLEGIGLVDGELMERLWSYLRSFNKITKEMTAENRILLLSEALLYFGRRKMLKIGMFLHISIAVLFQSLPIKSLVSFIEYWQFTYVTDLSEY